jgi:PPOX class probable F420-dependent enzyme
VTMSPDERALLTAARRAALATIDGSGRARLVPVCFVIDDDAVWSPIDQKPKSTSDPRALARVGDIAARPEVTLLVDRWSEDWSELAWLRVSGRAELVDAEDVPSGILGALRARYPQYEGQDLEHRPVIRISIDRVRSWFAAGGADLTGQTGTSGQGAG